MTIFAFRLQDILAAHERTVASLYGLDINGIKVQRLIQITQGKQTISATINPEELQKVHDHFHLTDGEMKELHAALAAEAIFRILLDRTELANALQAEEALFHLLHDADTTTLAALQVRTLDHIRAEEAEAALRHDAKFAEEHVLAGLEPAISAYEAALFWLDTARLVQNDIFRRGYLQMSRSLLTDALDYLAFPPTLIEGTDELQMCRDAIGITLSEVERMLI